MAKPLKTFLEQEPANRGAAAYANSTGAKLIIESTVTGYREHFIAFLTDFSQTFQSNWNSEEVYGRNDPIATFKSTKRTISIAFEIPAGSAQEAENNLIRTSNLIQMMYPGYHNTQSLNKDSDGSVGQEQVTNSTTTTDNRTTIAGGVVLGKNPLVKITFGNLIRANTGGGLLGWIGSLNWKPNLEAGLFVSAPGRFFPKVISISFDFNVLHQENLGQKHDPEFKKGKNVVKDWLGSNKSFPFASPNVQNKGD
jgi:hypothetical protein